MKILYLQPLNFHYYYFDCAQVSGLENSCQHLKEFPFFKAMALSDFSEMDMPTNIICIIKVKSTLLFFSKIKHPM